MVNLEYYGILALLALEFDSHRREILLVLSAKMQKQMDQLTAEIT